MSVVILQSAMLTKRIYVPCVFPVYLHLCVMLLLLHGPMAHGQCPKIFSYQRDLTTNQLFGYVKLQDLRIGQTVKLKVELSMDVALNKNNSGSIELVKSKEETIIDIYNNQPARYRINFPISNVIPSLLTLSVNGQTICTGPKATDEIANTIKLEHTLFTQLQPVSNDNGNNANPIEFQPVEQTSPLAVTTPGVYEHPMRLQLTERPQVVIRPQVFRTPSPQPQSTVAVDALDGSDEVCGLPESSSITLSINGHHSFKGQFPWAVPVFDIGMPREPMYLCGSTIISKYHLLTAGHCMYDNNKERRASKLLTAPGMHSIDNFFNSDIQLHYVEYIIVHPDYISDADGTELDIALMVLQIAIIYTKLVRPICLWNGNDNVEDIVGMTGFMSGWGVTENGTTTTPSYVNLTVVERKKCRRQLGHIVVQFTFCGDGHGAVPCLGDSGSGLVIQRGPRFYIRGIVSVGQYNRLTLLCDTMKYVVFTDVVPLLQWVLNNVRSYQASTS